MTSVPDFDYERALIPTQCSMPAGVDEAGRGALCGPVVAAAVLIKDPSRFDIPALNDSKKLTASKRDVIFEQLTSDPNVVIGTGIVNNHDIDEVNILNASLKAMRIAVDDMPERPDFLLIDGNRDPKHPRIACKCQVKGDSLCPSIAAASVIAKVTRDRIMLKYDRFFPAYGLKKHKGYGTKTHLEAIGENGITPIHRTSFLPCSQLPLF